MLPWLRAACRWLAWAMLRAARLPHVPPHQPSYPPTRPPTRRCSPGPTKSSAPPLRLGDSARHTETEGDTPTSQRSLLELVDEGWSLPSPPPVAAAAALEQPATLPPADAGRASSGSQASPFAGAAARQLSAAPSSGLVSPPSGRGSEALPPGLRCASGLAGCAALIFCDSASSLINGRPEVLLEHGGQAHSGALKAATRHPAPPQPAGRRCWPSCRPCTPPQPLRHPHPACLLRGSCRSSPGLAAGRTRRTLSRRGPACSAARPAHCLR